MPSGAVLGDALQSIIDLAERGTTVKCSSREQVSSLSDVVLYRLRGVANEVFDIVG